MKKWLIIPIMLLVLNIASAYTGTQPTGNQINCFHDTDCPYGYICPSTGQLAQCQSISGSQFLVCTSNSECITGQTCAKEPFAQANTLGTCQICTEHWALRTAPTFCYQDSSGCNTQNDLRKTAGDYPICGQQAIQPPVQPPVNPPISAGSLSGISSPIITLPAITSIPNWFWFAVLFIIILSLKRKL